jgi:O-antigen biosynthesis protein
MRSRWPRRVQNSTHVSFWNSNSFWYYTRADQNRVIDCPVRFQANRLRTFFPSEWHREHQIVYVKADLLKVAGQAACRSKRGSDKSF